MDLGQQPESKSEHWLKTHAGWAQLFLSIFVWTATVAYLTRGVHDQAEFAKENGDKLSTEVSHLSEKLDSLGGQINRLAISNEGLGEKIDAMNRRVDRIEKVEDGRSDLNHR